MVSSSIIALDVGDKRIGVAIANTIARLPRPLATLENDESFLFRLNELLENEKVTGVVVGLPRGLDGQETAQTRSIREFVDVLKEKISQPIALQDEALTSKKAEQELVRRKKPYTKGDIDALAASFILEDYLRQQSGDLR